MLRKRLDDIQAQTESEKEWWEKRRNAIQQDFMKELDEGEKGAPSVTSGTSEDEPILVEGNTPSATPAKKKKGKK